MTIDDKIEELKKENPELCLLKHESKNKESTTYQQVRDQTHPLYKCYDCLGLGMNVCEDYKPIKNYVRSK